MWKTGTLVSMKEVATGEVSTGFLLAHYRIFPAWAIAFGAVGG
jgi:hypothetical protein